MTFQMVIRQNPKHDDKQKNQTKLTCFKIQQNNSNPKRESFKLSAILGHLVLHGKSQYISTN